MYFMFYYAHEQVSDLIRDLEDEREAVRLQQEELESIKAELEEKNKQLERERKDVEKKKVCNAHYCDFLCNAALLKNGFQSVG
jgi:predicted transcriptional regulator